MRRAARSFCVDHPAKIRLRHPEVDRGVNSRDACACMLKLLIGVLETRTSGLRTSPRQKEAPQQHLCRPGTEPVATPVKSPAGAAQRPLGRGVPPGREQALAVRQQSVSAGATLVREARVIGGAPFRGISHHYFGPFLVLSERADVPHSSPPRIEKRE